jgi:hypothetical protein
MLDSYYSEDRHLKPKFTVLNSVNGSLITVGSLISDDFIPNGTGIIYPGGVVIKPESKPVSITFSWFGANNLEVNGLESTMGTDINNGG